MKKIKLNLTSKSDAELGPFAENHGTKVDAKPLVYTNLDPVKAAYDTMVQEYDDALLDSLSKKQAYDSSLETLTQKRRALETGLRSRARRVEILAGDDSIVITDAGFEEADTLPGPIGELPAPQSLKATISEISGRLDLKWKRMKGAGSYVVECRTHGATPGPWQPAKIVTAAKCSVTGLTPGQEYAFRVRAVGAAGEGPWSDGAVKMAV